MHTDLTRILAVGILRHAREASEHAPARNSCERQSRR